MLMLLFSRCNWCYRYLIWALFLLLFSFLRLSQLFSKRFNLAFVRHATRFAKAQLRSRGYCFARHLSYASVCRVHGSSNFRSCKQRIRVRFLKAMDLGVQRLEDFKEKFPSTFDARQPRFRFGCFGDRFVHFRSKRRNEPSARATISSRVSLCLDPLKASTLDDSFVFRFSKLFVTQRECSSIWAPFRSSSLEPLVSFVSRPRLCLKAVLSRFHDHE